METHIEGGKVPKSTVIGTIAATPRTGLATTVNGGREGGGDEREY